MRKCAFGELEFNILKIVRDIGRSTVRDVYEKLGKKGSYNTIMTVMSRMAEKGDLKREKDGKQYFYWITESSKPTTNTLLKRVMNKIFAGKPVDMVSYLIEADPELSDDDLKEIELLIKKRRIEKKHG